MGSTLSEKNLRLEVNSKKIYVELIRSNVCLLCCDVECYKHNKMKHITRNETEKMSHT